MRPARPTVVGLQLIDDRDDLLGEVVHGGVRQSRRVGYEHHHVAVTEEYVVADGHLVVGGEDLLDGVVAQTVDLRANGTRTVVAERGDLVVPVGLLARHPLDLDPVDGVLVGVVVAERRLCAGQGVVVVRRVHCRADGLLDGVLADGGAHRLARDSSGFRQGRDGRGRLRGRIRVARRGRVGLSGGPAVLVVPTSARGGEEEGQGDGDSGDSVLGAHGRPISRRYVINELWLVVYYILLYQNKQYPQ